MSGFRFSICEVDYFDKDVSFVDEERIRNLFNHEISHFEEMDSVGVIESLHRFDMEIKAIAPFFESMCEMAGNIKDSFKDTLNVSVIVVKSPTDRWIAISNIDLSRTLKRKAIIGDVLPYTCHDKFSTCLLDAVNEFDRYLNENNNPEGV